jgi:transposase
MSPRTRRRCSPRADSETIPVLSLGGAAVGATKPRWPEFVTMPQVQFPFFPEGVTPITPLLAFSKQDGRVTYFNGNMPVFVHDEADMASFRMITAQFCVNGNAKQAEIMRAFGVTKISLKRAVKCYREEGPKGFYTSRKRRGPAVLTPAVLAEAQQLLDDGRETAEVADCLGVKRDTLSKAVRAGRLHKPVKKTLPPR